MTDKPTNQSKRRAYGIFVDGVPTVERDGYDAASYMAAIEELSPEDHKLMGDWLEGFYPFMDDVILTPEQRDQTSEIHRKVIDRARQIVGRRRFVGMAADFKLVDKDANTRPDIRSLIKKP